MKMHRYAFGLLLLTLLVTGCGNRGIPVIKQELLDKKLSVLMLTGTGMSDATKHSVANALQQWRDSNQIAYDWMQDLTLLDDGVVTKLKARTYDYIYVIGNELLPSAEQVIGQGVTTGKWTLMQSQLDASGSASTAATQASLYQIDPNQVDNLTDKWISDVMAQNVSVEWITRGDRPIPSSWAPSEEADHIILLDNNEQWFQQLSYQTRQHLSKWIIFYTPADAAYVQKAKTLGVSVMDVTSAFSADLDWVTILNDRLQVMLQNSWKAGTAVYNEQELKELKMK